MQFIRTRSGRYLNLEHVLSLSVEESKIEIKGSKRTVFKVVAFMRQPLLPAVIGIYSIEDKAFEVLERIIQKISQGEKIVVVESEY